MLQLLASEDEALGLMQVATALDLPKGTVHGLLRTLSEVGFVTQDSTPGRYQVSPDLYRLGTPRLDLHELRARALNWTDALAARAEEAVAVAAFRDNAAVVAHYVLGGERTRPTHGVVLPIGPLPRAANHRRQPTTLARRRARQGATGL